MAASEIFEDTPLGQVPKILNDLLIPVISLLLFSVIVLYISSLTVKFWFPDNNSLNLSNTTVNKFDIFFNIKVLPLRIAERNNPGWNSKIIFDNKLSSSFSFLSENNLSFKLLSA